MRWAVALLGCMVAPSWAAHAYAQFGDIRYPANFSHFSYVNPQAPKGGEIVLVPPTRQSNFDKFNPFTLKGSAPPGMQAMMFDTLLVGNMDEPTTAYGLLASDIQVSPDRLSVIFHIHPQARFHNGDAVLAADVQYSFERLTSQQAAPQYRTYFGEIKSATVLGERIIRFDFVRPNRELPLIVGSLPVFSRQWGQVGQVRKAFDQMVMDMPIASGPYRMGPVQFGKDVTYVRDAAYWARDLNVRRGLFNFDRITYKIYKDSTAQLEAFKAGEFDYMQSFIAREWARAFTGRAFDRGELVKAELPHGNAGDFQGFQFNLRRDKFKDVRVRQAIALAMDFEWLNRQLFYNAYSRVRGYFVASDFEAKGPPGPEERALLEPLRAKLSPAVLDSDVPLPPRTQLAADSGHTLRDHLRQARDLLQAAGWTYRDGALRNAKGTPFTIEFLDSSGSMGRVVTPFAKNLEKLGIQVQYKVIDFALLQKRMDVFDFDMVSNRTVGSEAPGTELLERFGSKSADVEGSGNVLGLKDPAVDALLDKALGATSRPQLVASLRALDRVLRHGHYVVPHWYGAVHRVSWRAAAFDRPQALPRYYQPEALVTTVWWSRSAPTTAPQKAP
ncbi:ABC transporter substrate-binding protein [Limnohabitans sp. T6-5]|nr:extracellular solute-binding protein [Limnohabitans sp. T6-5]PUE08579.1 ABC transporter substrate-binding protein [Limnohabitans sp. T6-5]